VDDLTPPALRDETPAERADRNMMEAVQELRVAQTGVQILFAFLLSLPFLPGFPDDEPFPAVMTGALLAAAGATVFFIAPVASHRLMFRQQRKETLVMLTHRMSMVGLVLLAVAMALAVWVAVAQLWSERAGTLAAVGLAVTVLVTWLLLPRALPRRQGLGSRG
jgi:hypothetical protein